MFETAVGPIYTRNERIKRPGHEVNHSSQSNVEIKNEWNYTSAAPACTQGVEKNNFRSFYILMLQ